MPHELLTMHASMQIRTVALVISILTGALAIAWPSLPWHLLRSKDSGATCPLVRGTVLVHDPAQRQAAVTPPV